MGDVERIEKVSFSRLLRIIHTLKPLLLATDNIYELVREAENLPRFLSSLPGDTRVVQVTGPPNSATSLQHLAEKHGLQYPSKTSPLEEAEVASRLAATGVGAEVVVLENETKILVCRNVSLGPGGSSQSRYRRGVHVSILTMTKRIERILNSAKTDFDLSTEESDFGLERAEFTVYVSRTKLAGLIKPGHGHFIQVKVIPVYRNRVEFIPLKPIIGTILERSKNEQKIIVGIDPGTTCGLAVMTVTGTPIYVESRKGLSRGEIIRTLLDLGDPILIAADVSPSPEFVEKLAKEFEATIYVPQTLLTAAEKQEIAREYLEKFKIEANDSHSRDALVATIKAFNHYKSKFESIESELETRNIGLPSDEVKALVVKGYSVQRAIESLLPQVKENINETPLVEEPVTEEDLKVQGLREAITFYKERLEMAVKANERLTAQVKLFESKFFSAQEALKAERNKEMKEIRKDRDLEVLQREVEVLRHELETAREQINDLQSRPIIGISDPETRADLLLLKPIEAFTKTGLEKAFKLYEIRSGDVVLLLDSSGGGSSTAEELVRRGIRAVVSRTNIAHQALETLDGSRIPVIWVDEIDIQWLNGLPYTGKDDLLRVMDSTEKRKKAEVEKTLNQILEEYKKERQIKKA
jgi:predicted RNase H-like nuclease (RuvC/YqgF family)